MYLTGTGISRRLGLFSSVQISSDFGWRARRMRTR